MTRIRSFIAAAVVSAAVLLAPSVSRAQDVPPPVAANAATVENPYGLKAMLDHGDVVSKAVLGLLLIMSMGSWLIFFAKANEQRRILKDAKRTNKTFWDAQSLQEGITGLNEDGPFHFIAQAADGATKHHSGVLERVDLHSWVTLTLDEANEEVQERIQGGLAFLATVGSTAPFVGLFGTVWGILNALTAIGVAGQASIDRVAGPVGEALVMTAIGLAVAVPAVLSYNWLVRRNRLVMQQVRSFSSRLRPMLLSAA